jgi:hypothetical protein
MCRIMTPNWYMDIRWEFGRDSIPGGALVARIFRLELDSVSVHFLDSAGAGAAGDLTGITGDCYLVADRTRSRATHFMIATPTSMGITADTRHRMLEEAVPRGASLHQRIEGRQAHVPARLAESLAAETREVNLRAEEQASAAVVAAATQVAADMAEATVTN